MEATETKKFKITKEHCRSIVGDRVCPGCGGELEPLETVDNSGDPTYWAGCRSCDQYHWGVDEEIFKAARIMVEDGYTHYDWMGHKSPGDEGYERWLISQHSGTAFMIIHVRSALKKAGAL